jgi:SAM-dependent methyltransferase
MDKRVGSTSQLQSAYDEQYGDPGLKEWRELGGKSKALNIVRTCSGQRFDKVLECGAGDGSVLMHLDKLAFGRDHYALEISESGISEMKKRMLPRVKSITKFDGYDVPFSDDSFDLVILSHVLEHVEHPRILLRELNRVAPYLVIEIPLDYTIDVDARVEHLLSYGHVNVWTPAMLRFLLRSEGFRVVRELHSPPDIDGEAYIARQQEGIRRDRSTRLLLRTRLLKQDILRRIVPKQRAREFRYNAYTALCERTGKGMHVF